MTMRDKTALLVTLLVALIVGAEWAVNVMMTGVWPFTFGIIGLGALCGWVWRVTT